MLITTNHQDSSEVDCVADHFVSVLAGLELLGEEAARLTDDDELDRRHLQDAIAEACTEPAEMGANSVGIDADVIAVALDALANIEDDDLEDPLFGWIRDCPSKTLLFHQLVNGYPQPQVLYVGIEMVLAYHDADTEVRLIADDDQNRAKLIVSKGFDAAIRLIYCPAIIKELQNVAENY